MTTEDRSQGPDADSAAAPAGWYADPTNPGHERLWTGERWVAWIRPIKGARVEPNPVGWRPDLGHPGFERLWSGEMWTEEIRRADGGAVGGVGGPQPGAAAGFAPGLPPAPVTPVQNGALYHDGMPPDKLGTLGSWVRISFVALIAAMVAEIIANWVYINVQTDAIDGRILDYGHVESSVAAVHTTHTITFIVAAIVAILFVIWFYRAYRNIVRAGAGDLRFSPGWAIGGWFIPIFSFIRQKQIANDIWKASDSAATVGLERRREVGVPAALDWWWSLWVVSGLLFAIGNSTVTRTDGSEVITVSNLHDSRTGLWIDQVALAVSIVALILIFGLVRQISRMQDEGFRPAAERPGFGRAVVGAAVAVPPGLESTKTCPECAEEVKVAANVCRYCGHRFDAG